MATSSVALVPVATLFTDRSDHKSQTRAVPSALAVTTRRPSGVKAADSTVSVCPARIARSLPFSVSQTRAALSAVTTAFAANDAKDALLSEWALKSLHLRITAGSVYGTTRNRQEGGYPAAIPR